MLTSAMRGETLTPNPNECNSTSTSGTRGIYPYLYIALEMGDNIFWKWEMGKSQDLCLHSNFR